MQKNIQILSGSKNFVTTLKNVALIMQNISIYIIFRRMETEYIYGNINTREGNGLKEEFAESFVSVFVTDYGGPYCRPVYDTADAVESGTVAWAIPACGGLYIFQLAAHVRAARRVFPRKA